jgi:cellulose synthase/poly-beta-1,6-N-acetylglucosamine synthase-like glycosyltransferase
MEFRIFQSIFCETYKIQKAAFAFNEYVEKVFEKYILMLIEIRYVDWFSLCSLVLLNWARNKLRLNYQHCTHHDIPCEEENATIMFTIAGAIILTVTVLLALESRRLEVSIMRQKGIRSIHTYPSYLKVSAPVSRARLSSPAYR